MANRRDSCSQSYSGTRTPNDQRADVKNPNNQDHRVNRDNRANQLNPNHAPSKRGQ